MMHGYHKHEKGGRSKDSVMDDLYYQQFDEDTAISSIRKDKLGADLTLEDILSLRKEKERQMKEQIDNLISEAKT